MRDRLRWFGAGAALALIVVGIFFVQTCAQSRREAKRADELEAARAKAVAAAAEAVGAQKVLERALTAEKFENRGLRTDLEEMTRAGGRITERIRIRSETAVSRTPPSSTTTNERSTTPPEAGSHPTPAGRGASEAGAPAVPHPSDTSDTHETSDTCPELDQVGPALIECGVVDEKWWACSGLDVELAGCGTYHLPVDPELSKIERAPEGDATTAAPTIRTLLGPLVGIRISPEEITPQIGGTVCPRSWALGGKWAEARACVSGAYEQGRDDWAVTGR